MSFPRKPVSHTAQPKAAGASPIRKMPVAPPVYRPQPVPRVLQRKIASGQQPHAGQPPLQPVAPPVYRPEQKKIVQPKMAATQTHKPPKAPPVYRPEQRKVLQPKLISQPRKPPTPPPVYRPQIKTVQPRMIAARAHTQPMPPPVYRQGSSTIQRKVIEKTFKGKKIYYSDQDPSTKFNTREEAEVHELTLGLPRVDEGTRGPTLYNYTHTKPHCKISSIGAHQGPHTMGHATLSHALSHSSSGQDINVTFSEQAPSPEDWRQMVITEKGASAFDGTSRLSKRLVRALQDYTALYKATAILIKIGDVDKARYNISLLMQMSPYAVYCWKSEKDASHKSLKFKGEGHDIMDDSNIDRGGRWANSEAYQNFIEDRRLLMDDDFEESSSSSSSDDSSRSSDEDMSDGEAIAVDNVVNHQQVKYWFAPDEIAQQGDCFFSTLIALGLNGGNTIQQLRNIAAANGGQVNIATPLVWANGQDITALANYFGIRIRVLAIAVHGNGVWQDTTYGAGGPTHIIGQIYGGHYTPLRRG
jgi:hypothetical protein